MIELENITKIYEIGDIQVVAINDISFSCQQGEMISIMGASGSGKSSLMNIMGCLDRPSCGKYKLDEIDVSNLKDDQLAEIRNKKIGFVFQSFNLLPRASALTNVELPLVYSGAQDKHHRALEVLESIGLGNRSHHHPSEMSGGEQQRVAIARALINNPSFILADEPTGNLDTQTSLSIMSLLKEQHNKGITIVIVTHEEDIAAYTQRTLYLRDGKIIKDLKR